MVIMDIDGFPSSSNDDPYMNDGLECVKIKFVRNVDDIDTATEYEPEYVHQHFGDSEKIFGYTNLKVTIVYSEVSMKCFPIITYDKKINEAKEGIKAEDVLVKLKDQLPIEQMNMMAETKDEFRGLLMKEDNFKPFGDLISKFTIAGKQYEMYRVDESEPEFDQYLTRMQTLALWYINAAEYTDNTDPKWMHYLLFNVSPKTDGQQGSIYSLAGYASLYRFYAYPEAERPRIAHVLLLPQYRKCGMGASFLKRIYSDLYTIKTVKDITVEDPADNCVLLRDYVDCLNCITLPAFAPENLKKGFSDEMVQAALSTFKMGKRQTRRVYEILRLRATDEKDEAEMKKYRLDVKRRLAIPMNRSDKDWKKINAALDPEEVSQVAAAEVSQDEKLTQLHQMYEQEINGYKITLERMQLYPNIA